MTQAITATAPVRTCDCGGWTDTWFARHGAVFNVAVNPGVRVVVRAAAAPSGPRAPVVLRAENYGDRYAFLPGTRPWVRHALLEAAIESVGVPRGMALDVSVRSAVPPGAATGTSAAVCVALVGALRALWGQERGPGRCRDGCACRGSRSPGAAVRPAGSVRRRPWRNQLRPYQRVPGGHSARRGGHPVRFAAPSSGSCCSCTWDARTTPRRFTQEVIARPGPPGLRPARRARRPARRRCRRARSGGSREIWPRSARPCGPTPRRSGGCTRRWSAPTRSA